ncbi:MAG: diacylglycerol kinase family lipid kinase [Cyclobacteriaceae bacterium]|nr:diacylglycerol kinase family lipid kinase [Cyclobacteriaceae bacterium]
MKILIILNGISGKKKRFYQKIYPALEKIYSVEVLETQYSGHAEEIASKATLEKASVILAAGGDGTLHQVINGVLKSNSTDLPLVGLIPLGSANDFARTCSLTSDPKKIIALLKSNQPKLTDIGKIECLDPSGKSTLRYFINACSVGMGPAVVMKLQKSNKSLGPKLSYLVSIISVFFSLRPQEVEYKTSERSWKGKARVIAIANGRTFGDAIYIAPEAIQDDGLLNSFVVGEVPLLKFLMYLQAIKGKKKIIHPNIFYQTTSEAFLSSPDTCALEAEGELVGQLPAKITILPSAIRFVR